MHEHREKRRNKEQNGMTQWDLLTLADVRFKIGNFLTKSKQNAVSSPVVKKGRLWLVLGVSVADIYF